MAKEKKRGSRGRDWERLKVSSKMTWRDKRLHDSLTPEERNRVRLNVMLDSLRGKESKLGYIRELTWANPDALPGIGKRGMASDRDDYHSVTVKGEDVLRHLPTLNRGQWLEKAISRQLDSIGGPYRESQPPMVRKKKKRRVIRKSAKVARIRRKGHSRKGRKARGH